MSTAELALDYTVQKIFESEGFAHYFDFAEVNDDYRKPNTLICDSNFPWKKK